MYKILYVIFQIHIRDVVVCFLFRKLGNISVPLLYSHIRICYIIFCNFRQDCSVNLISKYLLVFQLNDFSLTFRWCCTVIIIICVVRCMRVSYIG